MKDPANYGQSTRIEKLEARVKELEEALVHSIGNRVRDKKETTEASEDAGSKRPLLFPYIEKAILDSMNCPPLFSYLADPEFAKSFWDAPIKPCIKPKEKENKSDYPKPIEEPIAPRAFEGPYSLNIYKPEHEEWFTSGITCSTGAMDTAKELSKNSKVIVRVRDKKGALVTEFKP